MFFGKNPINDDDQTPSSSLREGVGRGIKEFWANLSPDLKRRLLLGGVITGIIVMSLLGYRAKYGSKQQDGRAKVSEGHEIELNAGMIEKSLYTRTLDMVEQQRKQLEGLSDQIRELKKEYPAPPVPLSTLTMPMESGQGYVAKQEKLPAVQKQPPPPRIPPVPPPPSSDKEAIEVIGGINIVKNTGVPVKTEEKEDKKKEKIYLPPSFMEATLLSGVAAPTTLAGKSNPLPVLLRIKDLAVLPNKVKADLKGCFAIAEATGNLADERVHIRLLTMSCVAKNGDAVIDQSVKGFVVDEDGKVGLSGKVVAKMGIHIARSALAGFLAGFGEAVETTTSDISFNPLTGTTTQMWTEEDTKAVTKAGIGKGISEAAKELQKFYLQLAEQTLPVIEVGATKSVTLVISEGVNLDIKKQNTRM